MGRRKKLPTWILLDYSQQPPRFRCGRCDATRVLQLPALVEDVGLQADAFAEGHRGCAESLTPKHEMAARETRQLS